MVRPSDRRVDPIFLSNEDGFLQLAGILEHLEERFRGPFACRWHVTLQKQHQLDNMV